jgi:hypothetical protein
MSHATDMNLCNIAGNWQWPQFGRALIQVLCFRLLRIMRGVILCHTLQWCVGKFAPVRPILLSPEVNNSASFEETGCFPLPSSHETVVASFDGKHSHTPSYISH